MATLEEGGTTAAGSAAEGFAADRNFLDLIFFAAKALKYDPVTNTTTILVRNVQFSNNVTKAFLARAIATIIVADKRQEFWACPQSYQVPGQHPDQQRQLSSGHSQFLLQIGSRPHALFAKYRADKWLLKIQEDSMGKAVRAASELEEMFGKATAGQ
ncbi:hypothetical protein MLD38_034942 [Melastoma candidum]|uniref:Uncharacterized protein n=1 Tax=Melastoma candidum TaxID=119954 RepID=A0ACB9MBJ0_9MYRT|nr:hypothetical protein MLD38_034942 [Melastoma candidum]